MNIFNYSLHCAWLSLFCYALISANGNEVVKAFHLSGQAQGTTWSITYYSEKERVRKAEIDSIFDALDSALSLYKPYSVITAFNTSATGVTTVKHLATVVRKSMEIHRETNGLSDVTVAPLVRVWGFGTQKHKNIPSDSSIRPLLSCVGSHLLLLRNDSLIKTKRCVQIDVNGIAQGYSVDVITGFMISKGVHNVIVEIGGEVRVQGSKQPGGVPFRIGVESPAGDELTMPPMQKIIVLDSGAITSSGNYRQYYETRGRRVSHLINPLTGYPGNNELISATVYARDAITADGYDHALMLMGVDSALRFVEKKKELGAFFIYIKKDGTIADTASSTFRKLIDPLPGGVKQ